MTGFCFLQAQVCHSLFCHLFLSPAAFCWRCCLALELISLPRIKHEVDRMTCCWDTVIWIFQDGGWHHLGFLPTESSAIRSADPENQIWEPIMRWTGWLVPEILPFVIFHSWKLVSGSRLMLYFWTTCFKMSYVQCCALHWTDNNITELCDCWCVLLTNLFFKVR